MRTITAAELLNIWDRGISDGSLRRALDLLAAAFPGISPEDLAREPVGERDRRLLALREELFGTTIASTVFCPGCGERFDMSFPVDDIRVPKLDASSARSSATIGPYHITFRLPDTIDLASLPAGRDLTTLRSHLLARCVRSAERDGEPVDVMEIPDEVIGHLVAEMGEADPQASIQMSLTCPACAHGWTAIFDIVSFLWSEIDAWAVRVMREVHTLAGAYGWNESEILSLSPRRRGFYMAMVS